MIEFSNSEDQNLWSCLEDFDFSEHTDVSKLRIELYLSVIKSIGYCGRCSHFNKIDSKCNLLGILTSSYDRCSDFSQAETEEENAFDVMSEEFRREQENLSNFGKIRKYQRMPKKPHKEDKPEKKEKDESI
jgi:hypothetical protein